MVAETLKRRGFEVLVSENVDGCLAILERHPGAIDLLLTDVVMPDENAFDLLPRIKKARPDLPVLVMSAQNTFMTAIRASERGAYEYLPKPFDVDEAVEQVRRAARADRQGAEAQTELAGLHSEIIGEAPAMQEHDGRALAVVIEVELSPAHGHHHFPPHDGALEVGIRGLYRRRVALTPATSGA